MGGGFSRIYDMLGRSTPEVGKNVDQLVVVCTRPSRFTFNIPWYGLMEPREGMRRFR